MAFAGFVAICVGETLSEMVQVFPVPNAAFNYVKYWLGDEDVAWAIGTLYWYSWATIFAQQMISAANLFGYWCPGPFWPCITFYFFVPLALITLNLFPVDVSVPCVLYLLALLKPGHSANKSRVPLLCARSSGGSKLAAASSSWLSYLPSLALCFTFPLSVGSLVIS